jgi:hypothetical protein
VRRGLLLNSGREIEAEEFARAILVRQRGAAEHQKSCAKRWQNSVLQDHRRAS